ncbi:MAG TPA: SpoIID/LytB domain-containing protein [Acidimicrobiia bacterium]|nr:SpoIID/LytB domain-containing protein [Acidimicrobiia bacterium]
MKIRRLLLPPLAAALLAAATPAAGAATTTCLGVEATIVGSSRADELVGTPGPDVIVAGGGNDRVSGRGGDDLICAGPGNDTVIGGAGNDRLLGQGGDDVLVGGRGNDVLEGGPGTDVLQGGGGDDRLSGDAAADRLTGGPGADTLLGGDDDDTLAGGGGRDALAGGPGADRLTRVLVGDTVTDAGTPDAVGDTRWYDSLTLEPLGGTQVIFYNWVSGYYQRHAHPVAVRHAPGGLVLVERLSPEEYLLGLGEMPFSWHPAALRAQVIAARSYLANLVAGGRWGVMAEFGFDICGSAQCQVYLGSGRVAVAENGEAWAKAVTDTAGRILLYEGRPALSVYHSTAGDTTRSVQDVWLGSRVVPYLQAVEVPPQDSPFANWSYDLGLGQFLAILAEAGITFPGEVTSVNTVVTGVGEGPYRMRFRTTAGLVEVTADRIQSAMNTHGSALYPALLPAYRPDGPRYPQTVLSPTFTVRILADGVTVRFRGQGWGHQLGMPQYGAQAMALAGASTPAILRHFYSGLTPRPDPGFLPDEIDVGLGWDRSTVTLQAAQYVLRDGGAVVARGTDGRFVLTPGEGGQVVLSLPQ